MAQPLTTQSHTLTPPLKEHVALLLFQLQLVPVGDVTTHLTYPQYVSDIGIVITVFCNKYSWRWTLF